MAATFAIEGGGPVLAPFAVGLASVVMAGALTDFAERRGLFAFRSSPRCSRARGFPRSAWGPCSRISGSA